MRNLLVRLVWVPYNIRMERIENMRINRPDPGEDVGLEVFFGGAALVSRAGRAVLGLTGKDPTGMLNAVLTNEVPGDPSLGVYATLLNPKGRVLTDLRALKDPSGERVLVDTEPEGAGAAREVLGRYAPFSRVKIEDLSGAGDPWSVLGLYGPRAAELLDDLHLAEHESAEVAVGGATLLAVGVAVPVPGFDLIGPASSLNAATDHLLGRGALPADPDAYETARIRAGVPRFGTDITPENFPGECGILERAVSFKKGCYPGQETVARMHYRGHPNKDLHRLAVEGPSPEPGAEILQDGKRVGTLTSVAPLPLNGRTLALGYLSRKTNPDAPLNMGDTSVRSLALIGNES
ncbi:MAG: tRNA-modifying protein YgfZ [uncultured Rubrobacteraceae bacterium]|uniref:tRNA-modifying protein YgfZ n=1 Tax=uncultured Rubrobacteraceae bacterium TaxID=349277 RepID=A0A6J4SGU9_9ACTN|nr:MAG: tRNA-modifying protein YgfZ [uncultured Rubrobacteraceae bacterium]